MFPNVTLIDLPPAFRYPFGGLPDDIERITRGIMMSYISDPRSIILCTMDPSCDIMIDNELHSARMADPKSLRTIGVISRIDCMEKGTNAKRMILGLDVGIRFGYIGVVNRST